MPIKSRIAGSLTQTRRSAACANVVGTPDCRKARISVSIVIDSIDGRLAGSKLGDADAGVATASDDGALWAGAVSRFFADSRFSRDQRETKFSGPVIPGPPTLFRSGLLSAARRAGGGA